MASDLLVMLDGLRATRDPDSCLRGLNLFRKGVRGEEGPTILARYLKQSPEWQELQAIWDAQLTVQHYHVTVTLLLALADALALAASAVTQPFSNGNEQKQQAGVLAAGAASLANAVLHRRLKALYFNLSSDMRGKANAAMALLTALTAACSSRGSGSGNGGASLRDLVRSFDWSLSALPGLARQPREKKGESSAEHRQRYWQQWALGDTLKRPTRAGFCQLALSLLRGAAASDDAQLMQQLLQLRPLMGGLLNHLAADPPGQQLEVLQVLQKRVLSSKAAVPAAVQADVFSDAALQQLAAIAIAAPTEGEEEGEEEIGEENEGASEAGTAKAAVAARAGATAAEARVSSGAARQLQQSQQAATAALQALMAVAGEHAHGLAASSVASLLVASVAQQRFVLAEAGSNQLQPGQRRLLRLLLRLRPADSAAHLQLLLAAAMADAELAAAFLLALPYSLDPGAAGAAGGGCAALGRWFAHTAIAARLLQLLPELVPPGLSILAGNGGAAPSPDGRRARCLLRCCFPPCMHKAALSRGLQHANALVRHCTLSLLSSSLTALEAVLQDCSAAADAAGAAATPGPLQFLTNGTQNQQQPELALIQQQRRREWLALRRWLQQAARQQLPDPTMLQALFVGAEKEGWQQANQLQLTAVLRLLLLWQRLLPSSLADAHVDAERLMPQQPLEMRPQHQLLLLELAAAAANSAATAAVETATAAAATLDSADAANAIDSAVGDQHSVVVPLAASSAPVSASLLPPLRLLLGLGVAPAVRSAAREWLLRQLMATGAFNRNAEEAVLWLDCLPRGSASSEVLAGFLSEAVLLLLRRPHELYELQQQLLGSGAGTAGAPSKSGTEGGQRAQRAQQPQSSLLAPCALRQLLRVLPSSKVASKDKAALAAYVACVLCQLAQQQLGAGAASSLASLLLGVVRQEAARRQQGQEDKQAQQGQQQADGSADKAEKASKKERKRKQSEGAEGAAVAPGNQGSSLQLVLPVEGRPLLALLALLERQLGGGGRQAAGGEQGEEKRKKKKKTSRHSIDTADGQTLATLPGSVVVVSAVLEVQSKGSAVGSTVEAVAAAEAEAASVGGCCQLISQLAAIADNCEQLLATIQQRLAADSSGKGTCSVAVRQCLHLLEAGAGAKEESSCSAAQLALVQVLLSAVLASGCSMQEQRRCLQLLTESRLVADALGGDSGTASAATAYSSEVQQALAAAVAQLLHHTLKADAGGSAVVGLAAVCLPLLMHVVAAFLAELRQSGNDFAAVEQSGSGGSGRGGDSSSSSNSLPATAQHFLLLLPHMAASAVDAAAASLLAQLPSSAAMAGQGTDVEGSTKKSEKKQRKSQGTDLSEPTDKQTAAASAVVAAPAAQPAWLGIATAAVLRHQLASSASSSLESLQQQGEGLKAACNALLHLASTPAARTAGDGANAAAAALSCLLQMLQGSNQAAALSALGVDGQCQLLRACLERAANGSSSGGGSIEAASQLAAVLVSASGECRNLAATEILPGLLDNGGIAELALALPAAQVCLQQAQTQHQEQQQQQKEENSSGGLTVTYAALLAALSQRLLALFTTDSSSSGGGGNGEQGKEKKKKKKRKSEAADGGTALGTASESAAAAAEATHAAQTLLKRHAVPCLRLVLQQRPLAAPQRQQLLDALLPVKGWPVAAANTTSASASDGSLTSALPGLGIVEKAEGAVLLLTAGMGTAASVQELSACVSCFAATLAALFKLQTGGSELEHRLLMLLDGPVNDAVAALATAHRSSATFTELVSAAAGTLGTAVLRHRLPAATGAAIGAGIEAGSDSEAAAGKEAVGVSALRVLRRLMAALLPDEDQEDESEKGGKQIAERGAQLNGKSGRDSDSEGDDAMMPNRQEVAHEGPVSNPQAASDSLQLLQRLLGHSRFLPAMRATAAGVPPLPPPAAALPRPLASLLPLVDEAMVPDGAAAALGGVTASMPVMPVMPAAAELKKELCELLETLLDLHQQYNGSTGGTTSSSTCSRISDSQGVPERQLQQRQEMELVQGAEAALLPLLMAGYGASCSPADSATWSLAAAINRWQWERQQQGGGQATGAVMGEAIEAAAVEAAGGNDDAAALAALLHGPLSNTCFAWGPAAAALQQLASPPDNHSGEQQHQEQQERQRQQRAQLLQQRLPLDPVRAALTICHWPESCSLAAPGSSSAAADTNTASTITSHSADSDSATCSHQGNSGALEQLPSSAAAYDPGFLLPFCCACLAQRMLPPRAFAEAGLLSVCLRGLAASDPGCRAAAYQVVALFEAQLDAAAAPDFRERQQLSVLLSGLRAAVMRPFHRLPAVHAVFLAEAALLVLRPGAPMYPAVNKQLTRRAVLSITDVPLLGQLLLSGGQQHAADRRWMLQLLLAGLRTADDAGLYRRHHAFEVAMALHDSCVADPVAARLALRLLCTATFIPRAARQLTQESGLVPWLANVAGTALEQRLLNPGNHHQLLQRSNGGIGNSSGLMAAAGSEDEALLVAISALRRLLRLRAVMRGNGGAAAARHMVAAAHRLAAAALAAVSASQASSSAAFVCRQVLPFLLEVVQLGAGSHMKARQLQAGSGGLAALVNAVRTLQRVIGLNSSTVLRVVIA